MDFVAILVLVGIVATLAWMGCAAAVIIVAR